MPTKSFKPDHLELRHKTYYAVLYVPKEVQHVIGKSKFFETTQTHDLRVAQSVAALKVIKWKAEIAAARTRTDDPILKSAIELSRLMKTGDSPRFLVEEVINEESGRLFNLHSDLVSRTFNAVATGKAKVLSELVIGWTMHQKQRRLASKTIAQMKSDLELLTEYLPTTNLLVAEHTNQWIKLNRPEF